MIGHWARRIHFGLGDPVPRTLWHLVESEIARNTGLVYVQRCGKEMVTKRDLPWEFATTKPADSETCFWCRGGK